MYRVKEVDGVFIAQKFVWFNWVGISRFYNYRFSDNKNQIEHCSYTTLEGARARIRKDKGIEVNVKYHKEK